MTGKENPMSWNTIKIDPADRYFSKYIRLKAKKCMNCGRRGEGKEGVTGLQASHFHSRRKESVRFDTENVDVLCIGCHRRMGTYEREEYKAFKLKQLGQKAYDLLELRANTYAKKDRLLQKLVWNQALKELHLG